MKGSEYKSNAQVVAHSHATVPSKSLGALETIHINLRKEKDSLLKEMHRTTRSQIRRAEERELRHIIIENPTDQDLNDFKKFYNLFAKNKQTNTCNSFHIKTMKLLREQKGLMLSYIQNDQKDIICYRVYITDGNIAMNLYSASHFRMTDNPDVKRLLSHAIRLLIWKDIIWLKECNHQLYDMGGLTKNENIRRFKLGFGGEIVSVYSGYEANSIVGSFILKLRGWKMALTTARQIQ